MTDIISHKEQLRGGILDFQEKLSELPQTDIPLTHHFSKDIYGREILMPAGTIVIGKIHKHSSLNILAGGEISLLTEEGTKRLSAPYVVSSKPGIKRVIYVHKDATWVTVHGTAETDVDKIEEQFIAKTYDDVEELSEEQKKTIDALQKGDACLG